MKEKRNERMPDDVLGNSTKTQRYELPEAATKRRLRRCGLKFYFVDENGKTDSQVE